MFNKSTFTHLLCLATMAAATVLTAGSLTEVSAQRDPFQKPGYMKPKSTSGALPTKATITTPVNYGPPNIEARIEYFKRLRETAAANGTTLPKVTSVLTLNEMAVTGIFKTTRGYAAMVEATPIKLSYTIYPGEKFFDGQLVAVEENRLVFRKVTKVGEGKFVSSVENKSLRQYSVRSEVEGTAPTEKSTQTTAVAAPPADPTQTASTKGKGKGKDAKPSNPFLSPLDELNSQPADAGKDKPAKNGKKPVKVAKTKAEQ